MTRRLIEEFASRAKDPDRTSPIARPLTDREREVVALVAGGLTNDEIAERLIMSAATAKTHVSRAMIKLGARDRAQLVVFAYETGLVRAGWQAARYVGGRRRGTSPRPTTAARNDRDDGGMTTTALSVIGLTKRYGDRAAVDRSRHRTALGRRRRLRRAERLRQDHHHGDAARTRPPDVGIGHGARLVDRRACGYLPRVGAMIESPAFYPSLTGAENLRMFATVGGHDAASHSGACSTTSAWTAAATTATATTRWA